MQQIDRLSAISMPEIARQNGFLGVERTKPAALLLRRQSAASARQPAARHGHAPRRVAVAATLGMPCSSAMVPPR